MRNRGRFELDEFSSTTMLSEVDDLISALQISLNCRDAENFRNFIHDYITTDIRPGTDLYKFLHEALFEACRENLVNFADILFEVPGLKVDVRDDTQWCPIHYAVKFGSLHLVEKLIQLGANINVKNDFERTPLHLVAVFWKQNGRTSPEMLKLLLSVPDVNVSNIDTLKNPPLYTAISLKIPEMVLELVKAGADVDYEVKSETLLEKIRKSPAFIDILEDVMRFRNCGEKEFNYEAELYQTVMDRKYGKFRALLHEMENNLTVERRKAVFNCTEGTYTCLQYACEFGLHDFVRDLLNSGADPLVKHTTASMYPLHFAAEKGYYSIVADLIKSMKKHKEFDINVRTVNDETALHLACTRPPRHVNNPDNSDYTKTVEILLRERSIELNAVDNHGRTPLYFAAVNDKNKIVKMLLVKGAHIGAKDKFDDIVVQHISHDTIEAALDECVVPSEQGSGDCEYSISLKYGCLSPPKEKHPDDAGMFLPECEFLSFLSKSPEHRHLLTHPIIASFLYLKWHRVRLYWLCNLFMYFLYMILITTYIFLGVFHRDSNSSNNMKILLAILTVMLVYLILREVAQLFISKARFFHEPENWLEICMIVGVFYMLYLSSFSFTVSQHIATWTLLLTWVDFVLLLGKYPRLYSYIVTFKSVTWNFFLFSCLFIWFLIAFSLSFYLMFSDFSQDLENVTAETPGYGASFLSTIVKATGEFEFMDLPLHYIPISSHLIFLLFIVFIHIILLNLIVGLAVSDTTAVSKEMDIVAEQSRVELVTNIEKIVLKLHFYFLYKPFMKITQHLLQNRILIFSRWIKSKEVIVYPNKAQSGTTLILPCLAEKPIYLDVEATKFEQQRKPPRFWDDNFLSDAIVASAKNVAEKKAVTLEQRIQKMEAKLDQCLQMLLQEKNALHVAEM